MNRTCHSFPLINEGLLKLATGPHRMMVPMHPVYHVMICRVKVVTVG